MQPICRSYQNNWQPYDWMTRSPPFGGLKGERHGHEVNHASARRIYTRVGTDRRLVDNQLRELHQVAERMIGRSSASTPTVGVSGAKGRKDRPRLDELLRRVIRKEFDLVAAWSVDRLGRSLIDLAACYRSCTRPG